MTAKQLRERRLRKKYCIPNQCTLVKRVTYQKNGAIDCIGHTPNQERKCDVIQYCEVTCDGVLSSYVISIDEAVTKAFMLLKVVNHIHDELLLKNEQKPCPDCKIAGTCEEVWAETK